MKFKPKKITLTAALLLSLIFVSAQAQTGVDELRQDIDEKQKQLEQISNEILNLQREITRRQREAASLKNEVDLFDLQIRQTEAQIAARELEIQKLSQEIVKIQIEIKQTEEKITRQKELLAETLRLINEYDSFTPLEITFGNETFSEFLDQVQYAENLQEKNSELLDIIKALKAELESKKSQLERRLSEQEQAKAQLDIALKSLDAQRAGKQTLLSITRGQEKIYQELLGQAAQKQEEISREIFNLELAIRQQLGDKTLPPIEGALRWPASGILTQGYGNTGFTALGYTFHNGIDIAGPPGTKIYASGDGLVFAMGSGEAAYGNWIVIKHTISDNGNVYNIYTLYAHLQGFAVSQGQGVKAGDLIGYMGNSGNTTRLLYGPERGYHLHFTVFDEEGFSIKGGAYQHIYGAYQIPIGYTYDPMRFLR